MSVLRLLSVLLLVAYAASSDATLISPGTYTFNVDFTAELPYDFAEALVQGTGLDAGEVVGVAVCADINGGGGCFTQALQGPAPLFLGLTVGAFALPGALDGIFSVQLTLNTGSVDVTSFAANVQTAADGVVGSATLIPSTVPEPTTLALLGIGIAGLGFALRRRLN